MKEQYSFYDLMDIIRKLRGEGGCPWDREQTHESLRSCMIEESYEAVEAIDNKDYRNLCEELGDVLLQVALHTAIAEEKNEFTIEEVIQEECEKMIFRHPHVFDQVKELTASKVLLNWDELKKKEKNITMESEELLKVPKALPANIRAEKVQKKAAKVGMEFESYEQVIEKVYEELEELKIAKENGCSNDMEEEFGDLMFSIVNLSRFLRINAENSLTNATNKFINRFVRIERLAHENGKRLKDLSVTQLDELWVQVKELK